MHRLHDVSAQTAWQIVLRIVVGTYWICFSLMKWFDRSWVGDLLTTAAIGNYVPGYSQIIKYAASNSGSVAITITAVETVIGAFMLLGILTRVGAAVGTVLALNLMLTFVFCRCPWTQDFPMIFWFYFFPIVLNAQLIFDRSSDALGLQRVVRKVLLASTPSK